MGLLPSKILGTIRNIPNPDIKNHTHNRLLTKEGSKRSVFIPEQLAEVRFKNVMCLDVYKIID